MNKTKMKIGVSWLSDLKVSKLICDHREVGSRTVIEAVDEPSQHPHHWYEGDDLGHAPEAEEEAWEHFEVCLEVA